MQLTKTLLTFASIVACDKAPPAGLQATAPSASAPPIASAAPSASASASPVESAQPGQLTVKAIPLPGATGPAFTDYLAYEANPQPGGHPRVWIPVPSTGSVDVFDTVTGDFRRIDGWKTAEREEHGRKRTMGPSAVFIGEGFAFIGDRATNEVCPVDLRTLAKGACLTLKAPIDGVSYVASSHEVWVSTPDDQTMTILDASALTPTGGVLKVAGTVKLPGAPEAYGIDERHGLFFTNLEDKGPTAVVDVKKRKVIATWPTGCDDKGPRGLAVDSVRRLVMVVCSDHVQVLDAAHDGALRGKLEAGADVDNLDYSEATGKLYIASRKPGRLTVARVGDRGELTPVATVATREGARNAVVDGAGKVYIGDSLGASLLVAQ